jgi:hypothetical protein
MVAVRQERSNPCGYGEHGRSAHTRPSLAAPFDVNGAAMPYFFFGANASLTCFSMLL